MNDEYYKNAHKTKESMKQIIKIQSERLKALNQENRALKKDQLRANREIVYFKNQSRKKQNKIDEVLDYIKIQTKEISFDNDRLIDILDILDEDFRRGDDG